MSPYNAETRPPNTVLYKHCVDDLACFGGPSLFTSPKPVSNLVRPDFEAFLGYSRQFFDRHQYTNNGVLVRQLEQRLAAFHGTAFCVTFCSGFWALALAISALAKPGKREIVMPSLTYRRMADIAAWTGLQPHFCDVDPDTLACTAQTVAPCINDNTAIIVGVHPIVNCCDVAGLAELARQHGIPLLYDSVESVYEHILGRRIGGFGNAEVFSLGASKLVNGFEGGYLTTDDGALAEHLSLARGFGFRGQDNVVVPGGMNAKLNEIHAAMALASLDDLEAQVQRNRARYEAYMHELKSLDGIRLVPFDETLQPAYKNILVELRDNWPLSRDDTIHLLNSEKIIARAYYPAPLHRKSMSYPHVSPPLPVTDRLAERFLLLPCGHLVDHTDIADIGVFLHFIHDHASQIRPRLRALEEESPT